MNRTTSRQGKISPALLFLVGAIALLPIWMVGSYSVQSAANENSDRDVRAKQVQQADAQARQIEAQARTANAQARNVEDELQYFDARASQFRNRQIPIQQFQSQQIQTRRTHNVDADPYAAPGLTPVGSTQYRPVTETEYREKKTVISVPHVDPETGETTMREEEQVIRYPVQTTRWVKVHTTHSGATHNQKAAQLAAELRAMTDDHKSRDAKLNQLRKQLEQEFTELHSQQLVQIEQTEQRLESLKKLHDQRGENKKKIIDRRVDELLGKVDPLGWNPQPIRSPQAFYPMPNTLPIPGQMSTAGNPTRERFGYTPSPHSLPGATAIYAPAPIGVPGPPHVPGFKPMKPPQPPAPASPKGKATIRKRGPNVRVEVIEKEAKEAVQEEVKEAVEVELDLDVESGDAQASRGTTRIQVSAPRSALGDVFRLARDFAEARAESASAEMEFQQLAGLRRKGAIPMLEFQKAELKLNKHKRNLKLLGMELDAMTEAMQRVQQVAKSVLKRADLNRHAVMEGHKQGTHSDQDLATAKLEFEKAKVELDDATANLERLIETMATVKSFDTGSERPSALGEPNDDEQKSVDDGTEQQAQEPDLDVGR